MNVNFGLSFEVARDKEAGKLNPSSHSAGRPYNQLLPIAAAMDKMSPDVERKREEAHCCKK
jgi:hypothetical protein